MLKMTLFVELNDLKTGSLFTTSLNPEGTLAGDNPVYLVNHTNQYLYIGFFGITVQTTITAFNDGNMHKLELVHNGTGLYVYIDGTQVAYQAGSITYSTFDYIVLGRYQYGTRKGLCSQVKLENDSDIIFNIAVAEGAGSMLFDSVSLEAFQLIGMVITTFWAKRQDFYHANILEGFDLWEHATLAPIRVPIGATVTEAGYSFTSTNPAGSWHNGAETGIDLPDSLTAIQDATPITSLTKNATLRWVDGELDNFTMLANGTSTITEESNGTKLIAPDNDTVYYKANGVVESGKTYNYYAKIEEVYTRSFLYIGGVFVHFFESAIGTVISGQVTATSDGDIEVGKLGAGTGCVISRLYLWEAGTVPPLYYDDFEENFNNVHQAFSNVEDKKKRTLAMYSSPLSGAELVNVYKCTDTEFSPLLDEDGDILLDEDGDSLFE